MNMQTLMDNLRRITENEYDWTFSLYTSKKSRDGIELEISRCEMENIGGLVEATVTSLLEKVLPDRTVCEYSPLLAKEAIGTLEQSNELVSEPIHDIVTGVKNAFTYAAEDYMTGAAPSPNGYLFSGIITDEEGTVTDRVLFMKRTNPFIKGGKSRLCISQNGKIITSNTPMLKIPFTADLILIGGVCYILSPSIEKDLGMESRSAAITSRRMKAIADSTVVNNYEELEKSAFSGKNVRKFLDFDREILEYIVRLPLLERTDFLSEYGLTCDNQGLIDTEDSEQCELLIDLLCGRSCHDALGRLSVGSNILPR